MSDAIKHECGIAMIHLKKDSTLLQRKVWYDYVWDQQDVFDDGKAAQSRARWSWFGLC